MNGERQNAALGRALFFGKSKVFVKNKKPHETIDERLGSYCVMLAQIAAKCVNPETDYGNLMFTPLRLMFFRAAMESISREELRLALDRREVIIVDALPAEQFRKSHIPGAINIPAGSVAELAPRLLPDKKARIVTYCINFTGRVSEQVALELIAMGYKHVRNYEEGKQDWVKGGLRLEGEAPDEPVITFQPRSNETEAKLRAGSA